MKQKDINGGEFNEQEYEPPFPRVIVYLVAVGTVVFFGGIIALLVEIK